MTMRIILITLLFLPLALTACQHSSGPEPCYDSIACALHPALRVKPVPEGLGVNIHFYEGNENDLAMIEAAGMGIIRMDISWASAEKEPGVYDFSHYDHLVNDMEALGIRILFIIDYGNPLYDDGLSPHSEECRQAYARFCAALAERYADNNIIWELWNEPNIHFWKPEPDVEAYMAWCHAVVPAIRKADPDACIIGPATSLIDRSFLKACFERGFLELVDGVSVHPYRDARKGPETALREYQHLRKLIDRMQPEATKSIPIISGEWGYTTTEMTDEQQGKYLVRQWLANMAAGIPISIWYDWHDDGRDPEEREHNFGTVDWEYNPKPAFTAMRTLIAQLDGFFPGKRLPLESGEDFAVLFARGDVRRLAIWTTGDAHEITLPEGTRVSGGIDWLGNALTPPGGRKQPVTDAPRYLDVTGDF
jgi:polysaccharide biosynthesis protein PslG